MPPLCTSSSAGEPTSLLLPRFDLFTLTLFSRVQLVGDRTGGGSCHTSSSAQLRQQLLPTNSITAVPSTLQFQLPIVPDQPQIRASETKPNPAVALTPILTLILTLTLLTLLTPR